VTRSSPLPQLFEDDLLELGLGQAGGFGFAPGLGLAGLGFVGRRGIGDGARRNGARHELILHEIP